MLQTLFSTFSLDCDKWLRIGFWWTSDRVVEPGKDSRFAEHDVLSPPVASADKGAVDNAEFFANSTILPSLGDITGTDQLGIRRVDYLVSLSIPFEKHPVAVDITVAKRSLIAVLLRRQLDLMGQICCLFENRHQTSKAELCLLVIWEKSNKYFGKRLAMLFQVLITLFESAWALAEHSLNL